MISSISGYTSVTDYIDEVMDDRTVEFFYSAGNQVPYQYGIYMLWRAVTGNANAICIQYTGNVYINTKTSGAWTGWKSFGNGS